SKLAQTSDGAGSNRLTRLARLLLLLRGVPAVRLVVADANGVDAVLAHRLDAQRVAARVDHVAALRQPAQPAAREPPDGVVGVGLARQLDPVVREVVDRHVPAHVPVAVRPPPYG